MRSEAAPYLVLAGKPATRLKRIKLGEQEIREDFLQELLDGNPGILPVSLFDETFGPLLSLGREIMGIDNLFISPNGRLTLVETKLWRNPQATRHVLAQILDYATRLAALDYEEFEKRCISTNRSPVSAGTGLYQMVANAFQEKTGDESDFVDALQKNLRTGRFLLLVVGDGIREGLESILDSLHHHSRLHFTFGLVELKLYRQPDDTGILAVPNVVARSTEIERAVVTIRGATSEQVQVEVHSGPTEKTPKLTEQEFLERIKDPQVRRFGEHLFQWGRQHARIEIAKGGNSAIVRLPFSTTRKGLILLRMYKSGRVLMTPPRLRAALSDAGLGDAEVQRIADELKHLFPALEIDPANKQICPPMSATDLLACLEDVLAIYTKAIERLRAIDPGLAEVD
ncbi:MAG: hypothetical protein ACXIUL_05985 [Wenzhouxiangella sp.]